MLNENRKSIIHLENDYRIYLRREGWAELMLPFFHRRWHNCPYKAQYYGHLRKVTSRQIDQDMDTDKHTDRQTVHDRRAIICIPS